MIGKEIELFSKLKMRLSLMIH